MKPFPLLETERLRLRNLTPEDQPEVFAIFSDPAVTRYYDLETFTMPLQAGSLIEQHRLNFERDAGLRWGITLKDSPKVIGSCGFGWQRQNFSAVLGYDLAPGFWNRGIITEAVRAAIGYAFRGDINRITATTELDNAASIRVLQKLGFQAEGILREWGYWKGRFNDVRCFSLLRKDIANGADRSGSRPSTGLP